MVRAPRILIIDDDLGSDERYRALFCKMFALRDAASDAAAGRELAEVTFCSGQRIGIDDWVENDHRAALAKIRSGWPFDDGGRWALVCLDVTFMEGRGRRNATTFGLDLLQMVADDPALSGAHGAPLPVVMLSTDSTKSVEEREMERRTPRSGPRPHFFEKWSAVSVEQSPPKLRLDFARLLFGEALAEDGALRITDAAGVAQAIREAKIPGQALPLLLALREARRAIAGVESSHLLIDGESGEDVRAISEYIHDWRRAYLQYFQKITPVPGSIRRLGAVTEQERIPVGSTLTSLELDWCDGGEVKAVLSTLDAHGHEAQVVAAGLGDIRAAGPVARELYKRLRRLRWPSLRDRREDVQALFNRYLVEDLGEGQARRTVDAEAYAILRRHDWPDGVRELREVAIEVAREGRHRQAVLGDDVARAIQTVGATATGSTVRSFSELLLEMENFRFGPGDGLEHAWRRLEAARGALVRSLLLAAAEVTSNYSALGTLIGNVSDGEKNPTNPTKRLLERWGVDVFASRPPAQVSPKKAKQPRHK